LNQPSKTRAHEGRPTLAYPQVRAAEAAGRGIVRRDALQLRLTKAKPMVDVEIADSINDE
jgi:hypothetical protein